MDKNTDILHEAKRLRLLAAVLELQHYTSTDANVVPIPGGDRVIAIGTPAEVVSLVGLAPVADDFDDLPVRLPSGTKAIVRLPRPFTLEDGVHLMDFLSNYIEEATTPVRAKKSEALTRCAAGRDGECVHDQCPQLRDGEPVKSGRHCPLDIDNEEDNG
jgi:hypothetical protein